MTTTDLLPPSSSGFTGMANSMGNSVVNDVSGTSGWGSPVNGVVGSSAPPASSMTGAMTANSVTPVTSGAPGTSSASTSNSYWSLPEHLISSIHNMDLDASPDGKVLSGPTATSGQTNTAATWGLSSAFEAGPVSSTVTSTWMNSLAGNSAVEFGVSLPISSQPTDNGTQPAAVSAAVSATAALSSGSSSSLSSLSQSSGAAVSAAQQQQRALQSGAAVVSGGVALSPNPAQLSSAQNIPSDTSGAIASFGASNGPGAQQQLPQVLAQTQSQALSQASTTSQQQSAAFGANSAASLAVTGALTATVISSSSSANGSGLASAGTGSVNQTSTATSTSASLLPPGPMASQPQAQYSPTGRNDSWADVAGRGLRNSSSTSGPTSTTVTAATAVAASTVVTAPDTTAQTNTQPAPPVPAASYQADNSTVNIANDPYGWGRPDVNQDSGWETNPFETEARHKRDSSSSSTAVGMTSNGAAAPGGLPTQRHGSIGSATSYEKPTSLSGTDAWQMGNVAEPIVRQSVSSSWPEPGAAVAAEPTGWGAPGASGPDKPSSLWANTPLEPPRAAPWNTPDSSASSARSTGWNIEPGKPATGDASSSGWGTAKHNSANSAGLDGTGIWGASGSNSASQQRPTNSGTTLANGFGNSGLSTGAPMGGATATQMMGGATATQMMGGATATQMMGGTTATQMMGGGGGPFGGSPVGTFGAGGAAAAAPMGTFNSAPATGGQSMGPKTWMAASGAAGAASNPSTPWGQANMRNGSGRDMALNGTNGWADPMRPPMATGSTNDNDAGYWGNSQDTDCGHWEDQQYNSGWQGKKITKTVNPIQPSMDFGHGPTQMRSSMINILTNMGFKKEDADRALIKSNMNMTQAIQDLRAMHSANMTAGGPLGLGAPPVTNATAMAAAAHSSGAFTQTLAAAAAAAQLNRSAAGAPAMPLLPTGFDPILQAAGSGPNREAFVAAAAALAAHQAGQPDPLGLAALDPTAAFLANPSLAGLVPPFTKPAPGPQPPPPPAGLGDSIEVEKIWRPFFQLFDKIHLQRLNLAIRLKLIPEELKHRRHLPQHIVQETNSLLDKLMKIRTLTEHIQTLQLTQTAPPQYINDVQKNVTTLFEELKRHQQVLHNYCTSEPAVSRAPAHGGAIGTPTGLALPPQSVGQLVTTPTGALSMGASDSANAMLNLLCQPSASINGTATDKMWSNESANPNPLQPVPSASAVDSLLSAGAGSSMLMGAGGVGSSSFPSMPTPTALIESVLSRASTGAGDSKTTSDTPVSFEIGPPQELTPTPPQSAASMSAQSASFFNKSLVGSVGDSNGTAATSNGTDGTTNVSSTALNTNLNIEEFVPGKEWGKFKSVNVDEDPTLTPASAAAPFGFLKTTNDLDSLARSHSSTAVSTTATSAGELAGTSTVNSAAASGQNKVWVIIGNLNNPDMAATLEHVYRPQAVHIRTLSSTGPIVVQFKQTTQAQAVNTSLKTMGISNQLCSSVEVEQYLSRLFQSKTSMASSTPMASTGSTGWPVLNGTGSGLTGSGLSGGGVWASPSPSAGPADSFGVAPVSGADFMAGF